MNNTISILIPCYNGEKYIKRCIESCINQTYEDIEVVIIDDGSTDNSYALLKQYEKQDQRIKVYHQENKGLSETRNALISYAKGEYFLFLDIDDYITRRAIEKLYVNSNNGQYNIVAGRALIIFKKIYLPFFPTWWRVVNMTPEHYVKSNICTPWGQMIKTSFFKSLNVKFLKNEIFEDMGLMPYVFMKSSGNFKHIYSVIYNYEKFIRPNKFLSSKKNKSSLSSFSSNCNSKIFSVYKQLEYLLSLLMNEEIKYDLSQYKRYINGCLYQYLILIVFLSNKLYNKPIFSLSQTPFQAISRINIMFILHEYGFKKINFSKTWWKSIAYFLLIIWYRNIFNSYHSLVDNHNFMKIFNNKIVKKRYEKFSINKINNFINKRNNINYVGIDMVDEYLKYIELNNHNRYLLIKLDNEEDLDKFESFYYKKLANHNLILGVSLNKILDYEKILRYFNFIYSNNNEHISYFNSQKLKIIIMSSKIHDCSKINYKIIRDENI